MSTEHVFIHTQAGQPNEHYMGCYSWLELQHSTSPCLEIPRSECVCVCVCVYVCVRTWGQPFLPCVSVSIWTRQSQPSQRQTVGSGTERRRRRRPPSAAPRVKSLCVYTHDGSRPHCDVLFMPYQFIMTRPVPHVKTYMHTHTQTHTHKQTGTHIYVWLDRSSQKKLVCACMFAHKNI